MHEANETAEFVGLRHGDGSCVGVAGRRGPGANAGRGARASRKGRQDVFLFPRAADGADLPVRMLCCVDDTDDFSGSTSTGFVSELLARTVSKLGGQVVLGITRHQLLLSDQVEYTSHNSSMCFEARLPAASMPVFCERAVEVIAGEAVATADPGLCIAEIPADAQGPETKARIAALCDFGIAAQTRVCTKEEAYGLAASIPWVCLSEHGGTGLGVIGALAGIGLRLGGDDGRFRGKWNLAAAYERGCPSDPSSPKIPVQRRGGDGACDASVDIGAFVSRATALTGGPVSVVDEEGRDLSARMPLLLSKAAKPIMRKGRLTFVCSVDRGMAVPFEKVDLGSLGSGGMTAGYCERYERDADGEECAPFETGPTPESLYAPTCRTCLFRRFTQRGFTCVAK